MSVVLVVEDQKLMRTMLCDALEEAGYDTLEASEGLEGLNMIETKSVSLVISDLVMPLYDGANFLSLLKTCHPDIEVLSLTSAAQDSTIYQEAVKIVGEEKIMKKTDNFDDVINKVKEILG